MSRLAVPVLAAAVALAGGGAAEAATVRVPIGGPAGIAAARIAVDPSGVGAVLVAGPDGGASVVVGAAGRSRERIPVTRGSVIEGFGLGADAQPFVLTRDRLTCSLASVLVRDTTGAWRRESLGIRAERATLAVDPSGQASVLAAKCDGALSYHVRSAPPAWAGELTGAFAIRGAALSLATSGSGAALAASAGGTPTVRLRGSNGWTALPLPGGDITRDTTATTLSVAFDAAQRPVVFVVRGLRRSPGYGIAHDLVRSLDRFDGTTWTPVAAASQPIALVGSGGAFAVRDRAGDIRVESSTGTADVLVRPTRFAIGPTGALAAILQISARTELLVGS